MSVDKLSSQTVLDASRTISVREQLRSSFQDPVYRHAFLEEHVRSFIALQIRALREQRGLTQAKLGEAMGKAQAWISCLEDPDYGKVSVTTLLELAEAFDTSLEIRFVPFSETLDRLSKLDSDAFAVPSLEEDEGAQEPGQPVQADPVEGRVELVVGPTKSDS